MKDHEKKLWKIPSNKTALFVIRNEGFLPRNIPGAAKDSPTCEGMTWNDKIFSLEMIRNIIKSYNMYMGMALKTVWIVPRWSGRLERGGYVKGAWSRGFQGPN